MTAYQALFDAGALVRIRPLGALQEFRSSWKLHHPLAEEQLDFAGRIATVAAVGFYHGGTCSTRSRTSRASGTRAASKARTSVEPCLRCSPGFVRSAFQERKDGRRCRLDPVPF